MTRAIRVFVFLIGIGALAWGGALLALGLAGNSAAPRNVQVRRVGGERDEATPNRFTYAVSYEFLTHDGTLVSGRTQVVGGSSSARTPRRIRYFAAAPRVNAPEDQCGVSGYSLTLVAIGVVLCWATVRRRRTAAAAARSARRPNRRPRRNPHESAEEHAAPASDPEAARTWLRRYRRHSRIYAWTFFVIVVGVIGTIIRVELGEWSKEWLYATAFAAFVTWLLARYSRREAESAWSGQVISREVREIGSKQATDAGQARVSHIIHVRTDAGKDRKVRVGADLFEVFSEGMRVRKVAGLSYPLPDTEDAVFCPVCGGLLDGPVRTCPRCRAPVFRPADLP